MKIVVALGGNALGETPIKQLEMAEIAAGILVDLIADGHDLIITHGNGPQIGMIVNAFEGYRKADPKMPEIPFPEAIAMSQGYIGYHLQRKLSKEMKKRKINKTVATVVTEIVVDKNDKAFDDPTKPIGSFYSQEEAKLLAEGSDHIYKEDSGRGYRRVVASPLPKKVVEIESIKTLVDSGKVVITVGGGGIPVYEEDEDLIGIDCVVDKDFASSILAEQIEADFLIILTAVEYAYLNFRTEDEEPIRQVSLKDMERFIEEGHFAPGSMLPKVKASSYFASLNEKNRALITSLEKARDGILGKTGTLIKK